MSNERSVNADLAYLVKDYINQGGTDAEESFYGWLRSKDAQTYKKGKAISHLKKLQKKYEE